MKLYDQKGCTYHKFSWSKKGSKLAFILQPNKKKDKSKQTQIDKKDSSKLFIWNGLKKRLTTVVSPEAMPDGWMLPVKNKISWSKDTERLFFGLKPIDEYSFVNPKKNEKEEKKKLTEESLYDISRLKKKKKVDVWHWQDPLINSHQKKQWKKLEKLTYKAVFSLKMKILCAFTL